VLHGMQCLEAEYEPSGARTSDSLFSGPCAINVPNHAGLDLT